LDRLFIDGHFYSDKSPMPAVVLAGWYAVWRWATGETARTHPDRFCYWMTLGSSGAAYVVAVWCVFALGSALRLPLRFRLLLTTSFALATTALPYARHVNNHSMLLGLAAALWLGVARLAAETRAGHVAWPRLFGLGSLGGAAYTIDLAAGPLLLVCVLAAVVYRCRAAAPAAVFMLAALPWIIAHHALNYAVGGTFGPANVVAAYLQWPGAPFGPANMTGVAHHTLGSFSIYAPALLLGKRGFIGHDLPLALALPAAIALWQRHPAELPEILCAAVWCTATWLVYALTSNNYSGVCASIRWFVPLLAAGYFVLAVLLREAPQYASDLALLSCWGSVLAAVMWRAGPWMAHAVPFYWPVQIAAVLSWLGVWRWRTRGVRGHKWAHESR
jgi:hypothetical protein